MMEGTRGDLGNVFGVTQHPVEIKNYEQFVSGFKSTGQGVVIYIWGV